MNLCPVSDTGVPTFVETDTVCAEGVPKFRTIHSEHTATHCDAHLPKVTAVVLK